MCIVIYITFAFLYPSVRRYICWFFDMYIRDIFHISKVKRDKMRILLSYKSFIDQLKLNFTVITVGVLLKTNIIISCFKRRFYFLFIFDCWWVWRKHTICYIIWSLFSQNCCFTFWSWWCFKYLDRNFLCKYSWLFWVFLPNQYLEFYALYNFD